MVDATRAEGVDGHQLGRPSAPVWNTGAMSTSTDRRADRYGKPIVSSRAAKIIGALAGIVFLAVVAFVGLQYAEQPISTEIRTYEHLAPDRIAVEFTVSMDPGTEASCAVQAMNDARAQIGFLEAHIPAQSERHTVHRVEIATQGDAVSAEVLGCESL